MTSPAEPVTLAPRAQAEALAQALEDRGLAATVLRTHAHQAHPCVAIASRQGPRMTDYVYVAPEDGHWWFWWSWLELIAPAGQVAIAADTIAAAFARARGALPEQVA